MYILITSSAYKDKKWIATIKIDSNTSYLDKKIISFIKSNKLWKNDIEDFTDVSSLVVKKIVSQYPQYKDYTYWLYYGKDFLNGHDSVYVYPWNDNSNLVLIKECLENNSIIDMNNDFQEVEDYN